MLFSPVLATHQSRFPLNPLFPLLPPPHSSPFFSGDCRLSYATASPQPLWNQFVAHSFSRDGGVPPLTPSWISPFPIRRSQLYSSSFFSHSCALFCTQQKLNSFVFIRFRTLCEKHPGWGYPPPLQHPVHGPRRDVATCLNGHPLFPRSRPLPGNPCSGSVSVTGACPDRVGALIPFLSFDSQPSTLSGNFLSSTLVPISKNRRCAGQEASSHVRP
jgi:hypothetical protein